MGKVRTGLAVSLDGFISGPNDGPAAPMGDGGCWPGTAVATPNTGCLAPTWSSKSGPKPPSSSARPAKPPGRWCSAGGPSTSPMGGAATTPWRCRSCCQQLGPTSVGLPRITVQVRHRRTRKRPRPSLSGRRGDAPYLLRHNVKYGPSSSSPRGSSSVVSPPARLGEEGDMTCG